MTPRELAQQIVDVERPGSVIAGIAYAIAEHGVRISFTDGTSLLVTGRKAYELRQLMVLDHIYTSDQARG
jgi:hypothetical protein